MDAEHTDRALRRLRGQRVPNMRARSIGSDAAAMSERLSRDRARLGAVAEAWLSVCPPALLERTAIARFSRGVLTIRVADHATLWDLERSLAAGLERQLIEACRAPLRRVKLVCGADSA